jgi:hypothetical protein
MIDPFEYPDEVLDEICSPYFYEQLVDLTDYDAEFNGIDPPEEHLGHKKTSKIIKQKMGSDEDYPSKYTEDYWIRAYFKKSPGKPSKHKGKWLIFCPKKEIDAAWQQVKDATELGLLSDQSKVSTKLGEQGKDYVIVVYTKNWKNEKDVMRVREALRELGFEKPLPYKTDEDTLAKKYACKGDKRISKYYE